MRDSNTVRGTSQSGFDSVDVDRSTRRMTSNHGWDVGSYDPSTGSVTGPGLTTGRYTSDGRIYNSGGYEIGKVDLKTGKVASSSGSEIGSVDNPSDSDAASAAAFRLLDNLNC